MNNLKFNLITLLTLSLLAFNAQAQKVNMHGLKMLREVRLYTYPGAWEDDIPGWPRLPRKYNLTQKTTYEYDKNNECCKMTAGQYFTADICREIQTIERKGNDFVYSDTIMHPYDLDPDTFHEVRIIGDGFGKIGVIQRKSLSRKDSTCVFMNTYVYLFDENEFPFRYFDLKNQIRPKYWEGESYKGEERFQERLATDTYEDWLREGDMFTEYALGSSRLNGELRQRIKGGIDYDEQGDLFFLDFDLWPATDIYGSTEVATVNCNTNESYGEKRIPLPHNISLIYPQFQSIGFGFPLEWTGYYTAHAPNYDGPDRFDYTTGNRYRTTYTKDKNGNIATVTITENGRPYERIEFEYVYD